MQFADEVSFEIYLAKIGEIKFPKIIQKFFDGTFRDFFRNVPKK